MLYKLRIVVIKRRRGGHRNVDPSPEMVKERPSIAAPTPPHRAESCHLPTSTSPDLAQSGWPGHRRSGRILRRTLGPQGTKLTAPVAQLDRAFASGAKGHRFESCRADHSLPEMANGKVRRQPLGR